MNPYKHKSWEAARCMNAAVMPDRDLENRVLYHQALASRLPNLSYDHDKCENSLPTFTHK
jgi:hypothetical protein